MVEASATTRCSQNDNVLYRKEPVVAEASTTIGENLANEVCFLPVPVACAICALSLQIVCLTLAA